MRLAPMTVIICGLVGTLVAAGRADSPDSKTGLKEGTKAPAFLLKDQTGKERSLEEFVKKGPVALVFYRSASW
jgi:hypothetical protein